MGPGIAGLAHRQQTRIATLERQYGWTAPAATGSTVPDLVEYGQCDLGVDAPFARFEDVPRVGRSFVVLPAKP